MSREALHGLIDNINDEEIDVVYHILLKYIEEVPPMEDEIKAIQLAEEELRKGEVYSHEEVWS